MLIAVTSYESNSFSVMLIGVACGIVLSLLMLPLFFCALTKSEFFHLNISKILKIYSNLSDKVPE